MTAQQFIIMQGRIQAFHLWDGGAKDMRATDGGPGPM